MNTQIERARGRNPLGSEFKSQCISEEIMIFKIGSQKMGDDKEADVVGT